MRLFVLLSLLSLSRADSTGSWQEWLTGFGHDVFVYPEWIQQQMFACECSSDDNTFHCFENMKRVEWHTADELTYCVAKQWLLEHMPSFDQHFLPPSVSVNGSSMFDDTIAFTLMTNKATKWRTKLPLDLTLSYILPYASYHEARTNWRPLFFAKYFALVANTTSTVQAMAALAAPAWSPDQAPAFTNLSAHRWADFPEGVRQTDYSVQWSSSTSPPIIAPADFATYGYGSCTAWSTLLTYVARSVGIPARQVGTPCWNSSLFVGLAKDNPNVSACWHGGVGKAVGGKYLNNHNWVEYWDDAENKWVFINVPTTNTEPNQGLCGAFSEEHGCGYNTTARTCDVEHGGPAAAMRDHEIFAVSWNFPSEQPSKLDGGSIVDVAKLKLSSGEPVSPLVWSPRLSSPIGTPLKDVGLRMVNRTDFYRCKL